MITKQLQLQLHLAPNSSKGLTLIELVVVMGIFFMIVGSSLITVNQVIVCENNIQVESCKNSILIFINKSRLYCRNKYSEGDIVFDSIQNEIVMKMGTISIDKISLPKSFSHLSHNGESTITIDQFGFISNACTISFSDKFNKAYNLTICVGTGYLEIKHE